MELVIKQSKPEFVEALKKITTDKGPSRFRREQNMAFIGYVGDDEFSITSYNWFIPNPCELHAKIHDKGEEVSIDITIFRKHTPLLIYLLTPGLFMLIEMMSFIEGESDILSLLVKLAAGSSIMILVLFIVKKSGEHLLNKFKAKTGAKLVE
ncbi:MAG: hypothetical protein AAFX87_18530 [Bacteroidota bacterium]